MKTTLTEEKPPALIYPVGTQLPLEKNPVFMDLRLDRNEIAGSLGDLGTFIIFLIPLVAICNFNPSAILIFAGLFNVITGLVFRVPMAVQPMKAIGIIAISTQMSASEVIAAGILMGIIILILSGFKVFSKLMRYIPKSVVRGIQLGLGLIFLKMGLELITSTKLWWGWDSYLIGIVACVIIFLLFDNRKIPAALVIFGFGLFIALKDMNLFETMKPVFHSPIMSFPTQESFLRASWLLVVPQLPLTITNSLIATAFLVGDYFPEHKEKVNIDKIGLSVGIMNLLACPFGAMPMCHGAGGLSAQYRFGARTGGSVIFLGVIKVILGIFFGTTVLALSRSFPISILGAMMVFAGLELATHIKDVTKYKEVFIMVLVAGLALILNVAIGFLVGMIAAYFWKFNGNLDG